MSAQRRWVVLATLVSCLEGSIVKAQVDPVPRDLIQLGYNAALEGQPPPSGYAFYYRNQPNFFRTNLTLRLAVAPTYLDTELGIRQALGELTDVGIGLAGGGFAQNYYEINKGRYDPDQSFDAYNGAVTAALYHLFNPGQRVPLYGILRGTADYTAYTPGSQTASAFKVPDNMGIFSIRSGLRLGGREPILFPSLAMELSVWYEGQFRTRSDTYGYGDRSISAQSQLFWAEACLAYSVPNWGHNFFVNFTAGTSLNADRLSAYRLGALLPMSSEFPLSLPGYYYQELSAESFFLMGGNYVIPLDHRRRWNLSINASTAYVNYLAGLAQPGNWNSGVGGGVFYTSPSWRVMVGYGYGIDAIRSHGRGANSIGFLLQLDLERARDAFYQTEPPARWRSLGRLIGVLGS